MAVDGSFSLEKELGRFLDRCPKLKSIPILDILLKKGDKITEEEVVLALGELVLHPNYTIPLLGCFRPIAPKIIERTVGLLHLVPNLRSDDDNYMEEFDEDSFLKEDENVDIKEVATVIDVYVRRGKGLRLHELACMAFCRALDLIPFLLGSILNYFDVAPTPLERIMQCQSVSKALSMRPNHLLDVVRASYRFLILEPNVFTSLWDWSCILDLVHHSTDLTMVKDTFLRNITIDLRWCCMSILSVVLKLSFKASANLDLDPEDAFGSFLRWQEFCMDVSLEKGGWYLESSVEEAETMVGRKANLLQFSSLSTCSTMANKNDPSNHIDVLVKGNPGNPFILTSAMTKSFEMISLAVNQRWPVLLYGPAGCGKTALINKLAHGYGSRVLSIHMDEQIDGKTLLGSYVCGEQPGEFTWQPGSLTQAVLNGFWVVFEDVDKAPPDIISILLPLLEGANTLSTGHGEAVRVNECFRLFSTVTSLNTDTSRFNEGRNSLGAVWRKVMISLPSNQDLLHIVLEWYPELEYLAQNLIETYEKVNQLTRSQLGLTASSSYHDRFTLRDLLKMCKRVAMSGFSFGDDTLSALACENICKEAVDIFASFSTSAGNRLAIMREIAKLWTVPATETLYPVNKPIIQELKFEFQVGRVTLQHGEMAFSHERKPFVSLRASVHALERIACSVKFNEPVLLVGETGTGKTTLVQTLATRLGQKLTVLNLSQQSDASDLLGGFKPVDARFVCVPLYQEFENLFTNTFSSKDNQTFLVRLRKLLADKNWKRLLSAFQKGIRVMVDIEKSSPGQKRKRPLSQDLLKAWKNFSEKLERAHSQVSASDGMVFTFVEGALVTALKNGEWILLDEVNLAPPEILQRVIGVLEDPKGSICLAERGDVDYVYRHPNFRMFACMNPATDAGKRDLPISLRSRFTEYFVDDVLNDEDLVLFIHQFLGDDPLFRKMISKTVQFYKAAKESEERLQDGANQRPHYSLRSLYRALEYLKKARKSFGFEKSIYDGFCMFFLNSLDDASAKLMNSLICKHLLGGQTPPSISFGSYLIEKGQTKMNDILESYVLTASVKEHLKNLARAIFIGRYPVLLQGPTSSGKTSLVRYLAATTGHEFVRINNHEHTDLQEYLGSYITDSSGKLVFHEGALVKAVRKGHWIVLDELNLAPSDVLEALNRLLDDNRELFVPELQETIRAHPNFMLFATQNPPVIYAGRKMLSRAFRNRFVEIHVDEIPQEELSTILEIRCKIAGSKAKKMVNVMKELQLYRQSSKIFAGKHGFITPRDLFRWAERFRTYDGITDEDLGRDGYYLMAERLRDDVEKRIVKEVLEKQLKIKFSVDDLYRQEGKCGDVALKPDKYDLSSGNIGKIIWTKTLWRMYFLVERCYKMREPVLLVGETGGGKTTVCQLLSIMLGSKLHVLNCHQYTETSDFLGGFYPVRERSRIATDFRNLCGKITQSKAFVPFHGDAKISMDIDQASSTLNMLSDFIKKYKDRSVSDPEVFPDELDYIEKIYLDLRQLQEKWQTLFTWQDGPLVEAMKNGDLFLVDEISLADDSVLERLNSVLEPERKLSLAEKGGSQLENIKAHPNFFLLATMNPGGDYGKKELSPALRNRFTEIWIPAAGDVDELKSIASQRVSNPELTHVVDVMLAFWEWFNLLQTGRQLTIRDLLSWVSFINTMERSLGAESALVQGAFLVLLDGLSLGTHISKVEAAELRLECLSFLLERLKECEPNFDSSSLEGLEFYGWSEPGSVEVLNHSENMERDNFFGIHPFYIDKGIECSEGDSFEFRAPTTRRNTLRVLRAMQLNRPVLLEGSPGVGKTSLIAAIGRFSGHTVVRINLSEQTDIMDLLGSDLPVESDAGIQFAWSDGILLQALKKGSWVLLDELNLAPQSVLEGLNAILDHRAEVFIPELGSSFKCPSSFRVFACQNPTYQGGGRKGLPKSFLNRFTKVYVDELVDEDYLSICSSFFPSIERSLLLKLVVFNKRLHQETMLHHRFGQNGSPWEFNLRDVIRSCQIIEDAPEKSKPECFLSSMYLQRMRTSADRDEVLKLYEEIFGVKPFVNLNPRVKLNPDSVVVGDISIGRYRCQSSGMSSNNYKILPGLRYSLEAVGQCVKRQWLCILVGPPSSGKTTLIRLLAELTGNVINELNLSSATDISDLLGCFEQYNASRHFHLAIAQVERYMNEYSNMQLEFSLEAFIQRKDLTTRWLTFLSKINSSKTFIDDPRMINSIPQLVEIVEHLKLEIHKQSLPVSWGQDDLDRTLNVIRKLEEDNRKKRRCVKFEWVTGPLIKAIENGEWIVLENANLCSPTVLDRINSLLEQSGSITINECGTVEGNPVVVHPHPRFRIFLTVNPSYGEVSRAMRNRGVEIYLMQPWCPMDPIYGNNVDDIEFREVKRFIALCGIPVAKLVDMMAKAHIYAKHEGSSLGVSITYLELSHWVQLFQRLIQNGNQPAWSIQVSWEHTYLSSFGQGKGKDVVSRASDSFLSVSELYRFTSSEDCLLCLPGGFPTPFKLRNYVSYSKESYIEQNIMYLGSMGSQIASQIFRSSLDKGSKGKTPLVGGSKMVHLMDATLMHRLVYSKDLNDGLLKLGAHNELDLVLARKKLAFATDWVIEQATESDYRLYICWFEWFGSRLQPFFSFFNAFSDLLKKELQHSIWTRLFELRHELMHKSAINKDATSLPLLSLGLIDACPSLGSSNSCPALINLIKCVGVLRHTLQQWSLEKDYIHHSDIQPFRPVLTSVRRVEEKVLEMLVDSPSFDVLFKSYSDLLEHHTLFWNSVISSQIECRLISWRSLMKDAVKLQKVCPAEAELFQTEMKKLDGVSSLCLNSSKSLLWKYGGHPVLPSSAEIFQKQCKISDLCESIWPRRNKFMKLDEDGLDEVDGALFTNLELRDNAMEGICVSSCIIANADDNDSEIIQRLDEMYQLLWEKLGYEKNKLVVRLSTTKIAPWSALCSTCCVFSPDVLCRRPGLECWLKAQPILDETSLCLDLELLQHLTVTTVVDSKEQHHTLLRLSSLLRSSLNFSLYYSSRPPTDFSPHKNILWILDAWESVHGATEKLSSSILDMWFRWHAALWEPCPMLAETLPEDDVFGILLPHKLFWPLKLATVEQILRYPNFIKDYHLHKYTLRAASCNIWRSSTKLSDSHVMLLCVACTLFHQIIYAHKTSFDDSRYSKIRSTLDSIQASRTPPEDVNDLVSLLASSNHHILKSLIGSYIEPLIGELYPVHPSEDIQNIGCALLRIGGLRFNLLVCCDDLDPTLKYSIRYTELTEKIASLEIEIQVRKECTYLAGSTNQREADSDKINLLEELNTERRRLHRKMVFRPNPGKYKELKHMCEEFLLLVTSIIEWMNDFRSLCIKDVIDQVCNWQEITSRFIDRLSNEYSSYTDVIQPVQVSVYEIKLGLSLIVSGELQKQYLAKIGEENMDYVLSTIHKFVRFPRFCPSKDVSVNVGPLPVLSTRDIENLTSVEEIDMNVLQNVIGFASSDVSAKDNASCVVASTLPLKISIYHNVLARIKDSAADACFLGGSSIKCVLEIFEGVASLWMKHRSKPTDESNNHQFKFRPRAFKIESIIDIDVSNFANLLGNDSFSEWQELLAEELDEKIKVNKEDEDLDINWNPEDSDLNGIINIHNQLFGSVDLVQRPGRIQVADADRLSSFLGSYMLGVKMTQDLKGLLASTFDAKIAPEHLFRLCLEHDKITSSHNSARAYNFYKDSNPAMMAKLVEPISLLKQRIVVLLCEWDDHPSLQKIIEVIDMILALPLETSLAKALSALEFLLNRVQIVQDTVAKFPLSQQLDPVFALVSSWYKLEFESWPVLLDEVQSQFENNAGKLWFPLYPVFQQIHTVDLDQHNSSMIESLEEFFKTSNIGEFEKQLQLLLSFHGQISNDLNWKSYTSPCQEENKKVLYNTFGFYVQLLPQISEHIKSNRSSIEKELNELLKLCRWDRIENYLAIESFKRTRLKLRKIVKKYTDFLQQPLVEFLGREPSRSGVNTNIIEAQCPITEPHEASRILLDAVYSETQSKSNDSSLWFSGWWKDLGRVGEGIDGIKDIISTQSSCFSNWEERKQLLHTIEYLCTSLIHCGELWEDTSKHRGKRRALTDLLKLLDSCGLSKHRTSLEGSFEKSWLLQPSYEVQHLLLTQSDHSSLTVDVNSDHSRELIWKAANKYYFKSIAFIKSLEKISLNFHKDFSLTQVKRSGSYVDHLIEIQQEHRAVAYNFGKKLKCLRQYIWPLSNLVGSINSGSEISNDGFLIKNQHSTFKCMWHQKQLFDGFCSLLHEEHLLLQKVENNHLDTCSDVKEGVNELRLFIHEVLPDFQKHKKLLDRYLLGSYEDNTVIGVALHPYGVTSEMEQLVNQNFELIKSFEKNLSSYYAQEDQQGAVKNILLGHIYDLFEKARKAEELYSSEARKCSNGGKNINELECCFSDALKGIYKHIIGTFDDVRSLNYDFVLSEESLQNMKQWKMLFEKDIERLQLDLICEDVLRIIQSAGELLNYEGDSNCRMGSLFTELKKLHVLLDMILTFGDNLLQDFLLIHSMLSKVTCALAKIFASLFAKGFGSPEDQENESGEGATQDAHGTGMGEGTGLKDVSEQIEDEDQLLGLDEKPNEERDAKSEMQNKNEKGIEMEQDFDGDTFSVSEDSEEDDENEDDNQDEPQLDRAMGEVGDESNIVNEKLGDSGDDEENQNANEKYENGPSVKDKSSKDDELRAREDSAANEEDGRDLDAKESSGEQEKDNDGVDDDENHDGPEDMEVDKEDTFAEPSGINPEDKNEISEHEDTNVDELEADEPMEDGECEDLNDSDLKNDEERVDGELLEEEPDAENGQSANAEESCVENSTEIDFKTPKQDFMQPTPSGINNNAQSAGQSTQAFSDTADQGEFAPIEKNSNLNELMNDLDLDQTSGQPNASELEVRVADSKSGTKLSNEQSRSTLPPSESLNQKVQPNPFRSVGDALDGWKDRVKVSVDLEDKIDNSDEMVKEDDPHEYGYTANFEEGTAQALGPATAEQVKGDITQNEIERDVEKSESRDPMDETEVEKSTSRKDPIVNSARNMVNDAKKQQIVSDLEKQSGEPMEVDGDYNEDGMASVSENMVIVKRSYMSEEMQKYCELTMNDDDDELGKAREFESSVDKRENGVTIWRRYELLTTRLSLELAEQLRLVMEPTLASKLQGYYRTGKRISMKKVIQYIASHFRKDLLWYRRTKPSKRDYQVVIAVDDSRSMSEGRCGEFAVEALVTVCRAMSQLEVGNLAVASFGQQGNIRLLHDFDKPFTPEAGMEMISSLTFKQENTIADEPMSDLLKYLNNMLDTAVVQARLPSGYNPLQQLVLIIADGRFNEKEKLKRYVRDCLSKRRMVAFLLLDSPNESIMELMEATVQGKDVKFSKYLDSFPFPYYVVLKNIEALPRTLADLLRQWFELMQHSGE